MLVWSLFLQLFQPGMPEFSCLSFQPFCNELPHGVTGDADPRLLLITGMTNQRSRPEAVTLDETVVPTHFPGVLVLPSRGSRTAPAGKSKAVCAAQQLCCIRLYSCLTEFYGWPTTFLKGPDILSPKARESWAPRQMLSVVRRKCDAPENGVHHLKWVMLLISPIPPKTTTKSGSSGSRSSDDLVPSRHKSLHTPFDIELLPSCRDLQKQHVW